MRSESVASGRTRRTHFVHLIDQDGRVRWQDDVYPLNGTYPTSIWDKDEVVEEALTLPSSLGFDPYLRLVLGWYRQPSLARLLRTAGPDGQAPDRVEIPLRALESP
jgi:hypothetical protein